MAQTITAQNAPAAIGPYSHGVTVGGLLFTSGQIALDPATQALAGDTIEVQTRQVMENLRQVLAAAGTSMDRTVKTTCFLKNMGDFAVFNEIYGTYFTGKPARSCVEVSSLPKGALVEVEVIAEL